jgi:hypothetical protein
VTAATVALLFRVAVMVVAFTTASFVLRFKKQHEVLR